MHMNNSYDTETVNGQCVVLCFCNTNNKTDCIEYPTLDAFLERLMKTSGRVFLYNLRFDAEVMLKLLPLENIKEMLEEDSTTVYKNYRIKYFSNSSLVVKDLDVNKTITTWDAARFFNYLKLEKAAEKYLPHGEEKITSDVIEYFKDKGNTLKYFEANKEEITKYCAQDAKATKLLSDVFEKSCEKQGYDFKNPYSIGNLGMKFFKPFLVYKYKGRTFNIPRIHPCHYNDNNPRLRTLEDIQELLGRGGWNDCFKRGKFDEVWDADIVSAYPYIMRSAPYWDGEWIFTNNESELEEYTYGHVACDLRNLKYPMLPSLYQYFNESEILGGTVKWENHAVIWSTVGDKWVELVLPLPMYKYLSKHADVKFKEAYYLEPTEQYKDFKPLEKPIDILFDRKRNANKGSMEYNLAKILMNGTSGKFKQKLHSDNTWFFYPHLYGKITWDVKEMVLDMIFKNDLWADIVSVSTDGAVLLSKPGKINVEKKLGAWDLVKFSPFVQVGNGIYYGRDEKDEPIYRLRGFNMGKTDKNLQDWIEGNPDKSVIKLTTKRPLHLRECVKHHKILKVSDVGRFVEIKKRLNINQEIKRNWEGNKFENITEMLSGRILESKPWDYSVATKMSEEATKRIKKEMEKE